MRKRTRWLTAAVVILAVFGLGAAAQVSRKEFDAWTARVGLLEKQTKLLKGHIAALQKRAQFLEQKIKTLKPGAPEAKRPVPPAEKPKPDALDIGATYRLSGRTPLLPRVDSGAPLSSFRKALQGEAVKYISGGGRIHVVGMRRARARQWYHVRATDHDGTDLGFGWINSMALRGQEIEKVQ